MFAAVLLIWNTIRTAMFARRREIEVMKLVGATDWFIRIPFMLEGLIQGVIGGVVACVGAVVRQQPLDGRRRRRSRTTRASTAMVVDGYQITIVMVIILGIGALVGMIGSGIAASRFLDV